jgi:hypothetical protein
LRGRFKQQKEKGKKQNANDKQQRKTAIGKTI